MQAPHSTAHYPSGYRMGNGGSKCLEAETNNTMFIAQGKRPGV